MIVGRVWTGIVSTCILTCLPGSGAGRLPPSGPRTTLDSVYTAAQAVEGQDIYAARCRACHTQAAHVVAFKRAWAGQTMAEPFGYISETMPKDSPGTLSAEETSAVLAYFLQLAGMPAGNETLSADPEALHAIRIDTLITRSRQAEEKKS